MLPYSIQSEDVLVQISKYQFELLTNLPFLQSYEILQTDSLKRYLGSDFFILSKMFSLCTKFHVTMIHLGIERKPVT